MSANMDKMIAVVIPVYNAEKYIQQCIESVLNQKSQNFRLVIVDDGSTDNSLQIIKSLGPKHKGHIIRQENAGVSAARNSGIDYVLNHLNAKYIMFLDADDVWFPSWYDTEVEKLISEDFDTIIFNSCKLTQDLKRKEKTGNTFKGVISGGDKAVQMNSKHFGSTIYKTELLRNCNIRFHNGQRLGEDLDFRLEAMALSKNCFFSDKLVYGYRENTKSVSHSSFTALYHYEDLISGWIKSDQNIMVNGGNSKSAIKSAMYYIDDMVRDAIREGEKLSDIIRVLNRFENLIKKKSPEVSVEQYVQKFSSSWIFKQRLIGVLEKIRKHLFALPIIRHILIMKKYPIICNTFDEH